MLGAGVGSTGEGQEEGLGQPLTQGAGAGRDAQICGNSAPGIRNSMCKSPEVRIHWLCLRRRSVWLDPSGRGERVAGVIREMGKGLIRQSEGPELGAEAIRGEPRKESPSLEA